MALARFTHVPNRNQAQAEFSSNADSFVSELDGVFVPALNSIVDDINAKASQVSTHATATAANATNAGNSQIQAGIKATEAANSAAQAASYAETALQSGVIVHAADATKHLTSAQNALLDALTATAAELNLLSGVGINLENASNRNRVIVFESLPNNAVLTIGAVHQYFAAAPRTWIMPSVTNTVIGDTVELMNIRFDGTSFVGWGWAFGHLTINCPANVWINGATSLLCDDDNRSYIKLICAYKQSGKTFWSLDNA